MFRFENEKMLYLLVLALGLIVLFYLYMRWKKQSVKNLGSRDLVLRLMPEYSPAKHRFKFYLLFFSVILLILCLANPQIGQKIEKYKSRGIDLVVCLDISNSMEAQDIQPSRIMRSKQAIIRLLEKLHGDRIGLVVFAGQAYTQLPLTNDYGAARMFINIVNTNDVAVQGTAIGSAIEQAMASFEQDKKSKKNKAIIVISDGENHEDDAILSAKEARKMGIMVNTIGMGTAEGAPIPVYGSNNNLLSYKKDQNGEVVMTQINEQMLQDIAHAGGGVYVCANNTSAGVETIYEQLGKLEKNEIDGRNFTDFETRYPYFLAVALLLLCMELLIFEGKNKTWNQIHLFGQKKK